MFRKLIFVSILFPLYSLAEFNARFDILGSATFQSWNEYSPVNQDNRLLEIPMAAYTAEIRPDFQLNFNDSHSISLRSRHYLQSFETHFKNPNETRSKNQGESDLSDLFLSSNWTDGFSTTLGLQNYQWGPAELFSPTNPFFHFNNNQKSFFYKEKGRVLARANWNPLPESSSWSIVGIFEPIDNNTQFWIADKKFEQKSVLKIEYQFSNPANAIAFLTGQTDGQKKFFGEYFTWSPQEGLSLYADIQHQSDRTKYRPTRNSFGLYDMTPVDGTEFSSLGILGFRWEGRADFRQEFIFNEAGYNKEEWKNAKNSATTISPNLLSNLKRFLAPGLEFRTRYYSYSSVRIPDLGFSKMASLSLRWLTSLVYESSALQLNYEYNWNDHLVVSLEGVEFLGHADGEFRISADRQGSLGFRWSY